MGFRSRFVSAVLPALLLAAGCSRVTVIDTGPANVPTPAPAAPNDPHDVAITGVDFDPPLSALAEASASDVIFLVVVENRGTENERELHITVALSGGAADDLILQADRRIADLAAGQTRVERFPVHLPIALRSTYLLSVNVDPVPGEERLANNSRSYRLRLDSEKN